MFEKVTIVCIVSSYGLALLLEIARLVFRWQVRPIVTLGWGLAGLLAHSIVLWRDAQPGFAAGIPLSSWHLWYLLAAWLLTVIYLAMAFGRSQTSLGIFMLPVILILAYASHVAQRTEFPRSYAHQGWGMIHGVALLLGTVTASLGFVAGVMYLVQSYRLKHKLPPRPGFRLPSLEWLQGASKQMLYASSCFVAGGMFAGIILNIIRREVSWTDRVVVSSGVLLAWLVAATLFELLYKPAQQGRKVAYLTVASFIFLAMVLALALSGDKPHTANVPLPSPMALPLREVQP
jgi:hypothetical protein